MKQPGLRYNLTRFLGYWGIVSWIELNFIPLSRNCPMRKQIKHLFSSFPSLFFLLCPMFRKDSVKSLKIWNLKFVFILKWVNSLSKYHNQYLLKLLTKSFCFLIFDVSLVIVKFIIYSILASNFYIDNCIVF